MYVSLYVGFIKLLCQGLFNVFLYFENVPTKTMMASVLNHSSCCILIPFSNKFNQAEGFKQNVTKNILCSLNSYF